MIVFGSVSLTLCTVRLYVKPHFLEKKSIIIGSRIRIIAIVLAIILGVQGSSTMVIFEETLRTIAVNFS